MRDQVDWFKTTKSLRMLFGPVRQKDIRRPGPEFIKHFSSSSQLSMKFSLLINRNFQLLLKFHIHKH